MPGVKKGSVDDVSAVGNRDIGTRGMGNWYSTETEIKMGKSYSMEIEKSTKFITDPVVTEYVNRIGQNIVKNSDCKVPFTNQGNRLGRSERDGAAGRVFLRQLRIDSGR